MNQNTDVNTLLLGYKARFWCLDIYWSLSSGVR